jgi:predicted nucleic acid-binding protein
LITAIDSNVLIDVILADPTFAVSSADALADALQEGTLIVCEAVVAEVFPVFQEQRRIDEFFRRTGIHLEPSTMGALSRAGTAWEQYRSRNRSVIVCQQCGQSRMIICETCKAGIEIRQRLITDFLIGAHALAQADRLLTRDRGYFRTYFPDLKLV